MFNFSFDRRVLYIVIATTWNTGSVSSNYIPRICTWYSGV